MGKNRKNYSLQVFILHTFFTKVCRCFFMKKTVTSKKRYVAKISNFPGYPRHRETGKMAKKNPCQGKHREFGKFCQNTGKTQGILFAQVVNSLILKVKDISIFAAKIYN